VLTNSTGYYQIKVTPNAYKIQCTKIGFTTEQQLITIDDEELAIINFQMSKAQQLEDTVDYVDYLIQYGVIEGIIGGHVTTQSDASSSISVYDEQLTIQPLSDSEDNTVGFTVQKPDGTLGTIVVMTLENPADLFDTTSIDEEYIQVSFDGLVIEQVNDVSDLFSHYDYTEAVWGSVVTADALYVLVYIPEFSDHSILISYVVQTVGLGILLAIYVIIILIGSGSYYCGIYRKVLRFPWKK
jgi:hypothetical protein